MCGIAGLVDTRPGDPTALRDALTRMTASLAHRGPDGADLWTDGAWGVGLGHRRLSIVDLSDAGRQPMVSACGRYVLTYNGEIYNAPELAAELESAGAAFRGHSDTEVLLAACAAWGVREAVERCIGMFAFALWDRGRRCLTLARDRLGIKPLYWGRFRGLFLFGSELKALRAHPGWSPALDHEALAAYLRFTYVPTPLSIYQGVHKLPPGHLLTLPHNGEPEQTCYWNLRAIATTGQRFPDHRPEAALVDALQERLRDAVGRRMIADVPLGAFLSGGIDSSLVVSIMQELSNRPVQTFTIGFAEQHFNEAPHARAVARHLGTDHHEFTVSPAEARAVIPDLVAWYDEPFSDSSQIPTHLVSRLARTGVTVALSGDGGDEAFAGYNRYTWIDRLWRAGRKVPWRLRRGSATALWAVPPDAWDRASRLVPGRYRPPQAGDKLHKFAALASRRSPEEMYRQLVTHWPDPTALVPGTREPAGVLDDAGLAADLPGLVPRLQYLDMATYLHDDILTKVDRASMAVALEVRVPLLDHRVVEFAWALPEAAKIRGGTRKWLLRRTLDRYVPGHLLERPKMGFGVPIGDWLRGPLRDWAEGLIGERRLAAEGLFDPRPIRRHWDEHLSGRRNHQYLLWNILMVQAWREHWAM